MGDRKGMQAKAFVRLTSQFGTAAIGELKVVWLRDSLEAEKVKQIALTNLNIITQTSKPVSLSVQTASVELQETTQEEKQQSHDDLKIKTATFSAMLEGSGLRLEVTNLQASDFVFMEDAWVPRQLSGQVRYTSPTLQFSGSVNAQWENLNLSGFGEENAPVPLAQIQKGSSSLQGNWTPKIGRPAGIQVNFIKQSDGQCASGADEPDHQLWRPKTCWDYHRDAGHQGQPKLRLQVWELGHDAHAVQLQGAGEWAKGAGRRRDD
jgi:hypothetical protein